MLHICKIFSYAKKSLLEENYSSLSVCHLILFILNHKSITQKKNTLTYFCVAIFPCNIMHWQGIQCSVPIVWCTIFKSYFTSAYRIQYEIMRAKRKCRKIFIEFCSYFSMKWWNSQLFSFPINEIFTWNGIFIHIVTVNHRSLDSRFAIAVIVNVMCVSLCIAIHLTLDTHKPCIPFSICHFILIPF